MPWYTGLWWPIDRSTSNQRWVCDCSSNVSTKEQRNLLIKTHERTNCHIQVGIMEIGLSNLFWALTLQIVSGSGTINFVASTNNWRCRSVRNWCCRSLVLGGCIGHCFSCYLHTGRMCTVPKSQNVTISLYIIVHSPNDNWEGEKLADCSPGIVCNISAK